MSLSRRTPRTARARAASRSSPRRWRRLPLFLLAALVVGLGVLVSTAAAHDAPEPPAAAFGPIGPRLSDSGAAIALSYQGAIWRLPRSGGTLTRLTGGAGFDIEPAWSPDGKLVAYLNSRDFNTGTLRVVRADDGAVVPLPTAVTGHGKLHFDRAGQQVLGTFQVAGRGPALAWYDLQTGQLSPVPLEGSPPEGPAFRPAGRRPHVALSPDGRWIALVTTLDVAGEQSGNNGPHNDLWKVPARGGPPQRLTRFPARVHDLCWAADGQSLIVTTDLGGVHNDLWQVPLADPEAGARKLTFGQADEDRPSTSADGKWLLFLDNRHGPTALVLRDLKGGKDEVLAAFHLDYRRPTGQVELKVSEASGGAALTARLALQHADGKYHAPPGSLYRLSGGDLHFYVHEQTTFWLPAGRYVLKAWRGPEYRPVRQEFTVEPRGRVPVAVGLTRWTDQRARGWVSGESHIHANYGYGPWYNSPRTMFLQCAGEDLTVANFMVANSDGDGVFDREYFRGRPDPLSTDRTVLYWNEEFRSTIWGHMTLLNLKYLVTPIYTGFKDTTHPHDVPTNADIADHTHDQDGLVNYTHPAMNPQDPYLGAYTAKEMPLDVALGKVDSIDVMGSNHHANLPVWYRLLNCGLRVPASAGTDCFLNRIASRLPGSDRVYVHCPDGFSYRHWIDQLKAGRTFVTNGPMLELAVDGRGLGETMRLSGPAQVRVRGRATAQYPLNEVEVVVNGQVVARAEAGADRHTISVDQAVAIEHSGWIALRARGPRPEVALAQTESRNEQFAHTSPVYLEVADRPVQAREDARYFLAWIERLWLDVRQRDRIPPSRRAHVEAQISAAQAFYRKLAAQER